MTGGNARTASRRSFGEYADVAEAAVALLLASLAIAVLPFRTLMGTIANPSSGADPTDSRTRRSHAATGAESPCVVNTECSPVTERCAGS